MSSLVVAVFLFLIVVVALEFAWIQRVERRRDEADRRALKRAAEREGKVQ